MRTYTIRRASGEVPLCGEVAGTAWADAESLNVGDYPWFESGDKQGTTGRMLYDDTGICIQFICEDKHIYADHTEINSSVCEDSCVECFAMPEPAGDRRYFNLEINCCGNYLLGWGEGLEEISAAFVDPAICGGHLRIASSIEGPTKEESPGDDGWWVAAAVPYELIDRISGRRIRRPVSGTVWLANFYRCGGKTSDQYACWSPIDWPAPDFHRPEFFGALDFD